MTDETAVQPIFFGALYWRKGWFGPMCPPVILCSRAGRLSLATDAAVLFDEPIGHTTVSCTAFGTLKISAAGDTYALVGEAGALARSLSGRQAHELASIAALPGAWNLGSAAGSLVHNEAATSAKNHLNFGADGSTSASSIGRGATSMMLMPRWLKPLEDVGAQVIR